MSKFDGIQNNLNELKKLFDEGGFENLDTRSFKRAISYIQLKLAASDELITRDADLNNADTHLKNAKTSLQNYLNNRSESEFKQSSESLKEVVHQVQNFIEIPDSISKSYSESAVLSVDNSVQNIQGDLEKLNGDLKKIKGDVENLLDKFQKEFDSFIKGDGKDNKGCLIQIKELLSDIEDNFRNEIYGNGVDKKGWVASGNAISEELQRIINEGQNIGRIIGVSESSKSERYESEKKSFSSLRDICNMLLHQIGLGASVGGYQRRANIESNANYFWIFAMFVNFFVVITINVNIFESFNKAAQEGLFIEFFVLRFLYILPFVAFIGYASVKAMNHRKMELRYRQFELELATFEPNLQALNADVRSIAKLLFIQKIFGKTEINETSENSSFDEYIGKLNKAVEGIEQITQKMKGISNKN